LPWLDSEAHRTTFFKLLSPRVGERILDVGAGWGTLADLVRSEGKSEVYAVDPDRKRITKMKEAYPSLLSCLADSGNLPYQDMMFDKVYSTMALHHFPDQRKSIEEFGRVLKPKGSLLIVEVLPRSAQGRFMRFFENGVLRAHLRFLEMDQLAKMEDEHGRFERKTVTTVAYTYFIEARKRA